MTPTTPATITRAEFVRRMIRDGVPYQQAVCAYESVVRTIEDGICAGARITFGRVGSLTPSKLPPRTVRMGFERTGGEVRNVNRIYYLGTRLKYKFNLFVKFKQTRQLDWRV